MSSTRTTCPSSSLLHSTPRGRCRNINLLPIDYAAWPRLRSRLTLGGRACPRKPQVFGERDSHPLCRYSCLHLHFHALHTSSRSCFSAHGKLPYHAPKSIRSFGTELSPGTFSAQTRLTSELLRFLSRVAASKPTSWLSVQLHILSHLAHA